MARIEGKKIAIVVENYFEQTELTGSGQILEQAGTDIKA